MFWSKISLKALVYLLVGMILIIGLATLLLSVREFYNSLVREVIRERIELLETLNSTIYNPTVQVRIFGTFPELAQILIQQVGAAEGMRYVWVVDRFSKKIVGSVNPKEVGRVVEHNLEFSGKKNLLDSNFEGEAVKEILLKGFSEKVFIAGVSLVEVEKEARMLFLKQMLILGSGLAVSGLIIFLIINKFFINSILVLRGAFLEVGRENFKVHLAEDLKNEIGDVYRSFNTMVDKLIDIRAREKSIARLKSEFISIAAHQLRTPLSGVKWTMKMLIDGDMGVLKSRQKDILEKGYQTNERMIKLVSDLLDVARIEEGRFGYQFNYGGLEDIIENSLKKIALAAQQKKIRITFKKVGSKIPRFKFDAQKINLAIDNLLDNAIHYTHPGGAIEISLGLKGKFIEVSIKDTGVGVPKHQMNRLFTKFFRGENVMRMQTEGSGLGLFIVKNIIKRHGGDVWAESELNKGAAFHFTLPLEEELIPEKEEKFEEFIAGF